MTNRRRTPATRRSLLAAVTLVAALVSVPVTGSMSAPETVVAAKPDKTPPAKGRPKPTATPTPTPKSTPAPTPKSTPKPVATPKPKPAATPRSVSTPNPTPKPRPAATPRATTSAPQATSIPAASPASTLWPEVSGVGSVGPGGNGSLPVGLLVILGGLPLAGVALLLLARRRSPSEPAPVLEPAIAASPALMPRPAVPHPILTGDPLLEALAIESRQSTILPEPGATVPSWVGRLHSRRGPRHTVAAIPAAKRPRAPRPVGDPGAGLERLPGD